MIVFDKKRTTKVIVLGLLLLAAGVWRIYDCYKLDIWVDEASSLRTASGSLVSTWKSAVYFQLQPPVYFLLLNLWLKISASLEFARLLSVLFSLLSVFFVYRTWRYLFGDEFYWVAPVILLVHSFHLWAASEARGYASVIFFTSASTYYFIKLLLRKDGKGSFVVDAFLYTLSSLLGVFINYYVGFLLLGHFLNALFWFERKAFLRLLACYLLIGFVLLLWLPVIQEQLSSRPPEDPGNRPPAFESGLPVLNDLAVTVKPIYLLAKFVVFFPTSSLASKMSVLALFVLIVVAVIVLRTSFGRGKLVHGERVFLLMSLAPISSLFILSMMAPELVNVKYYVVSLGSLTLFLSTLLQNLNGKTVRNISAFIFVCTFLSISIFQETKFSKGTWKALCQHVESSEEGGDLILFFNSITFKTLFGHHYKGRNAMYAVPHEPRYDKYDFRRRIIQSEEQIIDFFQKRIGASGRIWLIGRDDVFGRQPGGLDLNGGILKRYLEERFDLVKKEHFENTAVVRLFVRKSAVSAAERKSD